MGLFGDVNAYLAALEARVARLEGKPVEEPEPEPEPQPEPEPSEPPAVPAGATPLTVGLSLRSNRVYTGSVVGRPSHKDKYGAWCEGISNTQIVRAVCIGFGYGLGLRSSERLAVLGYEGKACETPLYASGLVDCELSWLDLESDAGNTLDHAMYLAQGCRNMRGHDWRLVSGAGYALHLYCEQGSASGLDAVRLYLDARKGRCPAVFHNWANVHLQGVESYSTSAHYSLWDCEDVLVEDFEAYGGTCLVQRYSGTQQRVLFRNGSFHGPRLTPDGKPIPGVSFEDVRLV